jgi:hypothetical protein
MVYCGAGRSMEKAVPVTARLSRKFYDAFGDDLANELVEWFNQVDLTYRTELRELNELNFARFQARLEQEIARLDNRIDKFEFSVDAKLDRLRAELIRWMFLFWIGSVGLALLVNRLG